MTNLNTDELSNSDPEDISDVLLKVEKSFSFKFGKTELKDVKTFGELCDIITSKVQGDNSSDCTTQQAFYKLRNAIAGTLRLNKSDITPDTALKDILSRKIRRRSIKYIKKNLGFKTEILRPKHAVTATLLIHLVVSFISLFIYWQAGLIGLTVSMLCLNLTAKIANELDVQTVGQVAEKISRE